MQSTQLHVTNDSHSFRREQIRSALEPEFAALCSEEIPYVKWLFGEDLPKRIRDIKDTSKLVQVVVPAHDHPENETSATIDKQPLESICPGILPQGIKFSEKRGIFSFSDLFFYSYENEFLDNMIRTGYRRLTRSFNLCYRYIDDLIVFKRKKFSDYLKEVQWRIQTGAMGSRKPMKTANINLIQLINFVLGKINNQEHDSIFR